MRGINGNRTHETSVSRSVELPTALSPHSSCGGNRVDNCFRIAFNRRDASNLSTRSVRAFSGSIPVEVISLSTCQWALNIVDHLELHSPHYGLSEQMKSFERNITALYFPQECRSFLSHRIWSCSNKLSDGFLMNFWWWESNYIIH